MSARVLEGRSIAESLKGELRAEVAELRDGGRTPSLAIVRGGGDEAAETYARRLQALCEELGAEVRVEEVAADADSAAAIDLISRLNGDDGVTGVIVQTPLPAGVDEALVSAAVDPDKDVDGVNPENAGRLYLGLPALAPATAVAVMVLLERHGIALEGRRVAVIGRSNITGKPIAMLMLAQNATVTICHSRTRDLAAQTSAADVVVAAAGRPGMVDASMVAEGAVVVDVGTNYVDGALVGDVAFDAVAERAGAVSPVPGGVGPLTNLMLVRNLVEATRRHRHHAAR
jgi:methylenetetrahydrofolate dehydrogenase (NADP+)/methenyltetrahydrofolate cyclohydrolase